MEESININVDLHKTNTHYIAVSKERIWAEMLASLNWLTNTNISRRTTIQNGLGVILINSLGIIVEGFITDVLLEHLAVEDFSEPLEITEVYKKGGGWREKRKLYNKIFKKELEHYKNYKTIEVLFLLRNNLSHGKTHSEITKTEIVSEKRTKIESVDREYKVDCVNSF